MPEPITGRYGDMKKDGTQLCDVLAWTVNPFSEFVAYNSNCTGGTRKKIGTFTDWNGSFQYATPGGKAPIFRENTYFDATFNTSTQPGEGCSYTGNILVTAMPVQVQIDGANNLITWAVTFEGNGLLTVSDNP